MADEEELNVVKADNDDDEKKQTSQAAADNDDQNGQVSTSSGSSTPHHSFQPHYLEAHMVGAVPVTSSTTGYMGSHIGEIIEEEEEDDGSVGPSMPVIKQESPSKANTASTTAATGDAIEPDQSPSEQTASVPATPATTTQREPHEPPKFVLEAVKEDLAFAPASAHVPEPLAIAASTSSMKGTKQGMGVKFKVTIAETESTTSPIANQDVGGGGEVGSESTEEVAEIRVEEGYATRQMDEYFRQTIAAIKEELTRKLETQNDPNHDNMGEFDSNDEFNSDEFEEDDEATSVDGDDAVIGQHGSACQCASCCENGRSRTAHHQNDQQHHHGSSYHRRQQLIYQHLLNSTSGPNGSPKGNSKYTNQIGWLVILGFFVNQFIIDGLIFNYANIFESVYKETTDSSSKLLASLPNVFLVAFYLLVAPFAIFLTKRFGCRRIAVIGSLISSVSLLAASFMRNIIAFSVFYGIFNGIGISLVYVASLITLSKWFLKKRLFANSLATFGACIGSIVYPLLSDFLLRKYELNGALLILAGVQLNLFVSSLCLRQRRSIFSRLNSSAKTRQVPKQKAKSLQNKKSSSSALLIQRDENHENLELTPKTQVAGNNSHPQPAATATPQSRRQENKPKAMNDRQAMIRKRLGTHRDSETQSTTSTSTEANYTFKQYWRKFVQTRKTNANNKKNLFHLIAEEKRKTRTLSKVSLEDGFVITTSNNLLAPSDEHVIVSRQAKIQTPTIVNEPSAASSAKTPTSRFFTRIANSIRSLATGGSTNSPVHATSLSKHHLAAQSTLVPPSHESSIADGPSISTRIHKVASESQQSSSNLPIPLLAVFNGPPTNLSSTAESNNQPTDAHIPPQLASVFQIDLPQPTSSSANHGENGESGKNVPNPEATNSTENANQTNITIENCCEESDSDSDEEESRSPNNPNYYSNYHYNYANKSSTTPNSNSQAYKFSRYLSYRNSLTNSVRGSLMECSVPEDREEGDGMTSGGDGNSTVDYHEGAETEETALNGGVRRLHPAASNSQRQRYRQKGRFSTIKSSLSPHTNTAAPMNSTTSNPNDVRHQIRSNTRPNNCSRRSRMGGMQQMTPMMANARRIISTIDASSLYNLPFNLETVEHNLRNRLIKKNSDKYRMGHSRANSRNHHHMVNQSNASLFLDYLNYLLNMRLFFNPIVFLVNFSFLLTTIGYCVPLLYMIDFCHLQGIERKQSIYVLSFFGLATGFGRIVSTLAYKANESNEKGRLFTYNLTLFLAALCPLLAPILCDTIFSLIVFSVAFGVLFGFNSTLKPLVLYDVLGLEWCDDSLSSMGLFSQSFGIFIGLPVAGLIRDIYPKEAYVFYWAGSCLMLAFLILSPGRDLKKHLSIAYKNINKYYIQKKSYDRSRPPKF